MKTLPIYDTIEGEKGRIYPAAMVTVGRKDTRKNAAGQFIGKGNPTDKDGFFIMNYLTGMDDPNGKRARLLHPAFAEWNARPASERCIVKGFLGADKRGGEGGCIARRRQAWGDPDGKIHSQGYWCFGNGIEAQRLKGGEYQTIKCPGDLCEFSQSVGDKKSVCSQRTRLQFYLRLDGFPKILAEWDSNSPQSGEAALGMFDEVENIHKQISEATGVQLDPHFFGLEFTMQLTEKTNKEKRRRYPIVTFTAEGSPVEATQKRLAAAKQGALLLAAPGVTAIGAGPADAEEATRELLEPGKPYAPSNIRAAMPDPAASVSSPVTPPPDSPSHSQDKISRAEFDALETKWRALDKANGGDGSGWKGWLSKRGFAKGSEITQNKYAGLMAEVGGAQ